MLEWSVLLQWIQREHLDEQRLADYREAFSLHPAKVIILKNFLVEDVALGLYKFLSSEAEYETRYGLYSSHDETVSEQEWQAAEQKDRFYKYGRIAGPRAPSSLSPNLITFLRFRTAWSEAPFAEFFRRATGLPLIPSALDNAHAFRQGDSLLSHRDVLDTRRLAVVLYVSHGWQREYGGALEIIDRHGVIARVEPEFNSLVLFDVHAESLHQIVPVEAAAEGRARLTLGGWVDGE